MKEYNDFINSDDFIAVCGVYVGGDAVHVGIAWKFAGKNKIIHFEYGKSIPVSLLDQNFSNFFFNPIIGFKKSLLHSFDAFSELISNNKINFRFNRVGVVYDGGKFETNGIFQINHIAERVINCGVFVIGFLKSYNYTLVEWTSFPHCEPECENYLDIWLGDNGGLDSQKYYYMQAREIRGKHILVSPSTQTKPSPFNEIKPLSDLLIKNFATTGKP